jgi:F420-0:gamma-glutamyl ligase-like protein
MLLTLKVETTDETYEVSTNLFVVVQWERRFKRKASDMATGVGVEDLAYLAWESAKAVKIVVPVAFDDYLKKLVNIEVVSKEPENPTNAEPTAAN